MQKYTHIIHPIPPLYNENSRILILGSLPSVKSREQQFFYGHPQNRFWPLLAALLKEPTPVSIEEKRELALKHHIALWDTIYSCDIIGSSDSSIRNVVPTDLSQVISCSKISRIFCNGKTSARYFQKYQGKMLQMEALTLPSTSPANAAWSLEKLMAEWDIITECLNDPSDMVGASDSKIK